MMRRSKRIGLIGAVIAGLAMGTPVVAQTLGGGFEFLKAVKDRDGEKVTAALDRPGSIVVNTRDADTGETALHHVVARRDDVWLRFLLGRGANPNLADKRGGTPLQLAVNLGWGSGVDILLGRGASVDVTNTAGETPLIAAVHRRDAGLVRALLAAGANPDRADNSGRSARDYAALQTGQGAIGAELDKATAAREVRAGKTYGPGL